MNKKEILKEQIKRISPTENQLNEINRIIKKFLEKLKQNIKIKKIKAEPFLAGSFIKGTIIKKEKYDVDIFVRFKNYRAEKFSALLSKIVPKTAIRLHGSRDYFVIKNNNLNIEIVPVKYIKRPEDAENSTDLSYFHVKYVLDKIKKNKRLINEIKLAKAFIHYSGCYGAESYINGFSGYAVELLLIYYKNFMNFIKAIANLDLRKKLVIDIEKHYKKNAVFREMNESKLISPIILIDPTFKQRNALAALSLETLKRFQKRCRAFLKHPSDKFFQEVDKDNKKYKNFIIVRTKKQAGDIAGTKLKKFYKFFIREAGKYFEIESDFEYNEEKNEGVIYLNVIPKKLIEFKGPPVKMEEAIKSFNKQHKKIVIKNGKAYAYEKNNITFRDFFEEFKNNKNIEKMDINNLELN